MAKPDGNNHGKNVDRQVRHERAERQDSLLIQHSKQSGGGAVRITEIQRADGKHFNLNTQTKTFGDAQ